MNKRHKTLGFTLVELMVTLAVLSIVLGVGVPLLRDTIARNNIIAETNRLVASINFARSQAVTKGQIVTLANSGPNNQDWSAGWEVFTDVGREGNGAFVGTTDIMLKTYAPHSGELSISSNASAGMYVSFNARGMIVGGADKSFAVCDSKSGSSTPGRVISLNRVGRPSVTKVDNTASCNP